ncbi:hypothetical protein GQ53DRAFT_635613 [Thozetella sp. PMI_491]|nr:hypothetical protein GQ53DRAFT_635613 [Thozetella sp. PMI_491]
MAGANSTGQGQVVDPARAAESKTAETLSILAVFYGLAMIFVGLRVYVRAWMIKAFGKDDVVMCLCALFSLAGFVCLVIQGQHGLGRHQDTISADDYRIYKMAGYWFIAVQTTVALGLLKVSIALNLLRFSGGTRWYFLALWTTIIFVTLYSVAYFILQMFQCTPLAGSWDTSLQAQCRSSASLIQGAIVNTVLSVTTDVVLALLPIPVVWHIKRDLKVRAYLIIVLSLGYFAVGLGVVKVIYQWRYASSTDRT